MKVTVVPSWKTNTWSVKLSQGVQSFHLVYCGTKADAQWYSKLFRKALAAHDAEKHKLLEATCAKVLQAPVCTRAHVVEDAGDRKRREDSYDNGDLFNPDKAGQ